MARRLRGPKARDTKHELYHRFVYLNSMGFRRVRCHWCDRAMRFREMTVDHVIPLNSGGTNDEQNLVPACDPCNQKRDHLQKQLGYIILNPNEERRTA
jgi:5-methylcytosine-specific restriction endonuclease McrA